MATIREALRRVYNDIVVRRCTVRIVNATTETRLQYPPVFVIGVYRSGTTLVRYVLDSHSHVCCAPESDFVAVLSELVDNGRYSSRLERMGFDKSHVTGKLRELCLYFFQNYASSRGKTRWADKSPLYVDHLSLLDRLFPEAQFIMLYRHGLDQAHSYTRGGTLMRDTLGGYCSQGEDIRVGAVRYWRDKVTKMLEFQKAQRGKCLPLRYEDLCTAPEEKLRSMFAFINEPWEPQVLRFYEFPHDKGAEDGRVAATRGFSLSASHYGNWPSKVAEQCLALAEPMLTRLGYSA